MLTLRHLSRLDEGFATEEDHPPFLNSGNSLRDRVRTLSSRYLSAEEREHSPPVALQSSARGEAEVLKQYSAHTLADEARALEKINRNAIERPNRLISRESPGF